MRRPLVKEDRAAELRRAFDATFAARPPEAVPSVELLAIGVGGEQLALRVSEMASIHRAGRVQPLPGAPPEMLGLSGIRGRVVPVYDLAGLVGRPSGRAAVWLVLTGTPVVALAFDQLDAQHRVAERDIVPATTHERFVRSVTSIDGTTRAILDLRAVWEEVRRRVPTSKGAP
jgi:purine-binding chemotaxis protein CheW